MAKAHLHPAIPAARCSRACVSYVLKQALTSFFFVWCRFFFFSPTFILEYLQRGMLRPGLLELLAHMRSVGATIVVYTHSEEKWCV